jgi:SAM-dependent methyltransferase
MARASIGPLLRRIGPGARVIDLGGGSGLRAAALVRLGHRPVVVEPDPAEAGRARIRLGPGVAVVGELGQAACGADAVLAWHVLEHVDDLDQTMAALRAVLRPGGWLVAAAPDPTSAEARAFRGRWHGWEPARHRWHLPAAALARLAAAAGLEVAEAGRRGGWGYPAGIAFSLAPGLDPQVRPERATAGRALCGACVPAALALRAAGGGGQAVLVARRPATGA